MNFQPPSGGCELKHFITAQGFFRRLQPPSGGCELKQIPNAVVDDLMSQPPSGGCELKLNCWLTVRLR